jgi:tetratricopeptide (TPR) repeat protein
MSHRKLVVSFLCLGVILPAIAVVVASAWQPAGVRDQSVRSAAVQQRQARKIKAVRSMNAGDHLAARVEFERMISSPQTPLDPVDGRRMMAMSLRLAGEAQLAEVFLDQAIDALSKVAEDDATKSAMKLAILMDRADLAAFSLDQPERALELYDQVRSADSSSRVSVIAARNAAFLAAKIGKLSNAAERVDALLALPAASQIPEDERTELLASQASWYMSAGDAGQAHAHYLAIWNNQRNADSVTVANAGAACVGWYPVQTHCNEMLMLAKDVLSMVDRIKATGSAQGVEFAVLRSCEQQVASAVVSAEGCASPEAVQAARRRLPVVAAAGR